MAINSQAREYVLGQMAQTPELRGALSQMSGKSANAARMVEEFQRLNPNNYNRYNPGLGTMEHQLHSAGWGGWANDPTKRNTILESELYKDVSGTGAIGDTKHFDRDSNTLEATAQLRDLGITDMDQIGIAAGQDGNAVFYSKLTGQALPNQLKGYKSKGQTTYFLNLDDQGNVFLDDHFQKDKRRSGLGKIAPGFTNPIVGAALAVAGGFAVPGLGAALGSSLGVGATAGTALAGAGMGALHAGVTGGDIGKSALLGGIGGGLGTYLKGADFIQGIQNPIMQGAARGALTSAGVGGAGAALYGGDPLKGALGGALSGGLGGAGGAYMGQGHSGTMQQVMGGIGSRVGGQFGQQLAGNLIGSPYDPRQPQQQRQMAQSQMQQVPDWFPQHAKDAIMGLQGTQGGFA